MTIQTILQYAYVVLASAIMGGGDERAGYKFRGKGQALRDCAELIRIAETMIERGYKDNDNLDGIVSVAHILDPNP